MKPRYHSMMKAWPRDKIIAQWHRVANDPANSRYPCVMQMARDALAALHAEPEREPGVD